MAGASPAEAAGEGEDMKHLSWVAAMLFWFILLVALIFVGAALVDLIGGSNLLPWYMWLVLLGYPLGLALFVVLIDTEDHRKCPKTQETCKR